MSARGVEVFLDDGSFRVPREYVEAIGEEYDERGHLTVAQAASLVEKWGKQCGNRA